MSDAPATLASTLVMLSHARHNGKRQGALLRDPVLRVMVTRERSSSTSSSST